MKLGVVASADPLDVTTWSGTPYYLARALLPRFPDLVVVRTPRPIWYRYLRPLVRRATRGVVDIYWSRWLAALHAKQVMRQLKKDQVDAVLCIGNAPLSAYIAERFPTIHVSDATVPLMRNYYVEFSRLPRLLADNARTLDGDSVRRSRACLFPTEWAANSAIRDYGADPSRVHVIPWGANIDADEYPDFEPTVQRDTCHLVFIGVDWERKGGGIAVAATRRLADAGHKVKLHIVGAAPTLPEQGGPIELHGFINKGTEQGRETFRSLMKIATFLFMPTRHECFGMVFPEANSFGVPVISTATGGVPCVVHEGINGHLLSIDATEEEYAELIWSIWSDALRYERLRNSSREQFCHVLNWNSWVARAAEIIESAAWQPAANTEPTKLGSGA